MSYYNERDIIRQLRENPDELTRLLGIHLARPKATEAFHKVFMKLTGNDILRFRPTFSLGSLLMGSGYYLYRKMYTPFIVFFLAPILLNLVIQIFAHMFVFASLFIHAEAEAFFAVCVLLAVTGLLVCLSIILPTKYLYLKKFLKDLIIAGYGERERDRMEYNLARLGGTHRWVIALYIVMLAVMVIFSICAHMIMTNLHAEAITVFF